MFQDVIIINGPIPKNGVADYERVRIKARPLGRPYVWDNTPAWNKERAATNGGFFLVFEAEDGSVYIQEIEWEVDPYPDATPDPRTYYFYEVYASLAEARAGGRGWLIEYALGNE
jgi:hypothetical protein